MVKLNEPPLTNLFTIDLSILDTYQLSGFCGVIRRPLTSTLPMTLHSSVRWRISFAQWERDWNGRPKSDSRKEQTRQRSWGMDISIGRTMVSPWLLVSTKLWKLMSSPICAALSHAAWGRYRLSVKDKGLGCLSKTQIRLGRQVNLHQRQSAPLQQHCHIIGNTRDKKVYDIAKIAQRLNL